MTTSLQTLSPARALWSQRERIAALQPKIESLSSAIGERSDFSTYQWAQILAFTVAYTPDLIIELGRRYGNSTCCFLQAAHELGGREHCRVVSLDVNDYWLSATVPRIAGLVSPAWIEPAEILTADILDYDFSSVIAGASRCLLFWDAHGFEIAERVLSNILPQLASCQHVVIMHDISDSRFEVAERNYGESGIWKGRDAATEYMWLGNIVASVGQAISVLDFATRNRLPLHSAVESFQKDLISDQREQLEGLLGRVSISQAHWHWFTLSESPGPITFPNPGHDSAAATGEIHQLRQAINAMQGSSGWRALEKLRRLRERWAPVGTLRRRVLDAVKRSWATRPS